MTIFNSFTSEAQNPCKWKKVENGFSKRVSQCYLSTPEGNGSIATSYQLYECSNRSNFMNEYTLRTLFHAKEVIFIGDSTMRQQAILFGCMLGYPSAILDVGEANRGDFPYTHYNLFSHHTSIRYVPVGKLWGFTEKFSGILQSEWKRSSAVIVLNQGIHHHSIESELLSDISSLANLAQVTASFYEHVDKRSKQTMFIWRETVPQNHPSSNGIWIPKCHMSCRCVPLNTRMKLGQGLSGSCEPSCFPANARNILANRILEKSLVPIAKIYEPLSTTSFNIHKTDVGCTHLNVDSILFSNFAWLNLYVNNLKG